MLKLDQSIAGERMQSDSAIAKLFERHDESQRAIQDIRIDAAVARQRLDSLERRTDQMMMETDKKFAQIMVAVQESSNKIQVLTTEQHGRKQVERFAVWLTPLAVTVIGCVITATIYLTQKGIL